jgi:hypothetical protein
VVGTGHFEYERTLNSEYGDWIMWKQRMLKLSAALTATAFTGLAGCESLTGIFDQFAGVFTGA